RKRVNRLPQISFRIRPSFRVEIQSPQNRVRIRTQEPSVGVQLLRGIPRGNIRLHRHQRSLRIFFRFRQALILVQVGIPRALGQHLRHAHQRLRFVRVEGQDFLRHLHHLVGVVGLLVSVHHRLIEQRPQLAIRKFGGEVVRCLLLRRGIGQRRRRLVRIELRLCLGLRWTLSRRCRRLSRHLSCRRALRRLILPETRCCHSQHRDNNRHSLHALSLSSCRLDSNPYVPRTTLCSSVPSALKIFLATTHRPTTAPLPEVHKPSPTHAPPPP